MGNTERILGKLEAHHRDMMRRLMEIEDKVESLQAFRWKLVGITIGISAAISILINLVKASY